MGERMGSGQRLPRSIRKFVGPNPRCFRGRKQVSRAQSIVCRGDRVLMVKHQAGETEWWCLPGGGIHDGESPEDAALRELQEECRVTGSSFVRPVWSRMVPTIRTIRFSLISVRRSLSWEETQSLMTTNKFSVKSDGCHSKRFPSATGHLSGRRDSSP